MDRDTEEGGHVKMEAKTEVIPPHAKECLRLPKTEKARKDSPVGEFQGNTDLPAPSFQTSSLLNCERIYFYYFKPSSL